MKTILFPILATIIFASCSSDKEQVAASKVAALWGAESATIGHAKVASTSNGNHNLIVLTLKNLKSVEQTYSKEKITSISALSLMDNIGEKDYKDYDQVKIVIDDHSSTFEKVYSITDLIEAKPLIKKASGFFDLTQKKDTLALRALMDKTYINDTIFRQLISIVNELDSSYGKVSNVIVTGFSNNKMKDSTAVLTVASEVTNGSAITVYTFEFDKQSKQIVGVSLNNE